MFHLLSGFSQMARELVRLGAEVDRVGSDGMTPLHYASRLQILTLHVFWVLVVVTTFSKKKLMIGRARSTSNCRVFADYFKIRGCEKYFFCLKKIVS